MVLPPCGLVRISTLLPATSPWESLRAALNRYELAVDSATVPLWVRRAPGGRNIPKELVPTPRASREPRGRHAASPSLGFLTCGRKEEIRQ